MSAPAPAALVQPVQAQASGPKGTRRHQAVSAFVASPADLISTPFIAHASIV